MKSYECLTKDTYTNWNIIGVNLGGLFVLEPWITPSMFYLFLNVKDSDKIGMDMFTFCKALGPIEGKRQLTAHFEKWVNETHLIDLVKKKITHVRIPIGDWMFEPYGPYIGGTSSSIHYLDSILDLCEKYNLQVLLDLHGVKDSQNGLDNSGQTNQLQYVVSPTNNQRDGTLTFIHWSIISANWMGNFDVYNKTYTSINYNNIDFTKRVLYSIIDKYKHHNAVFGIEALNEPWFYSRVDLLKDFYYDVYKYIHYNAPHLKFIYHDSFRSDIWDGFLVNCSNVAIDWHIYQAWDITRYGDQFLLEADNYAQYIDNFKQKGIQMVIGEYSLATDNCAMWLNGFQDNLEGYPITECKYAPCPFPYIDVKDLDRIHPIISPYGTGLSSPRMGTCPYEGLLVIDDSQDYFMNKLAMKKLDGMSHSQGWFFWNFRTEYEKEISWSYVDSYNQGLFKGTTVDPIYPFPYYSIGGLCLLFMFGIGYWTKKVFSSKSVSLQSSETNTTPNYPYSILKNGLSTGNIVDKYQYESIQKESEMTGQI
jgi:glucan 1,3-beta-glucosidase